jgi:hypothetical protein
VRKIAKNINEHKDQVKRYAANGGYNIIPAGGSKHRNRNIASRKVVSKADMFTINPEVAKKYNITRSGRSRANVIEINH